MLASDGSVVGVVVSKLNAKKISEISGDIPQNVNFAVRGEIAKLFLSQNGVDPLLDTSAAPISPEDLAGHALSFTAFIECF